MDFYRMISAAGVICIGLAGSAFSHTTTKHYAAHHYTASGSKKSWHSSQPYHGKTVTHPPGTGHAKGYHAPKSWKHAPTRHKTYHPTYHKPVPGRTTDGRFVLPGGMESVCSGGTPPPCQ